MSTSVITSFEELNGPDHELWRSHRALLNQIPREFVGYRGCLGLGMSIEAAEDSLWEYDAEHIFARDALVTWYVMQDLPRGKWSTALNREVHLASVRRTNFRYGMPCIGQLIKQFDFRRCPYDRIVRDGVERDSDAECLKPSADEQAFKAFNAIEWAMTSTAFAFRGQWVPKIKHYYAALGLTKSKQKQLLFGQEIFDEVEPSRVWMPQPYIAFRIADAEKIFERSTSASLENGRRNYTFAFKQAFFADLEARLPVPAPIAGRIVEIRKRQTFGTLRGCHVIVIMDPDTKQRCEQPALPTFVPKVQVGAVVAQGECLGWDGPELPESFHKLSIFRRWMIELPKVFYGVNGFESVLRMWFERQHVRLSRGYLHLPATVAGQAAMTLGVTEQMAWNIAPAMPYFNEPLNTFVFPTIRQGVWNEHRLDVLPEVELDVRLRDDYRFLDWPEDFVRDPSARRRGAGKTEKQLSRMVDEPLPDATAPVAPTPDDVAAKQRAADARESRRARRDAQRQAEHAAPSTEAPATAPVTPEPRRVNKKEFREQLKKSADKARPNSKKHRHQLHTEPTRTVFDTKELNTVRKVLEMPLVDATTADSQAKADALAFEHDPHAAKYRRPYLPKTYEKVDVAQLTDEEWERMVAARAQMKAAGVAT